METPGAALQNRRDGQIREAGVLGLARRGYQRRLEIRSKKIAIRIATTREKQDGENVLG
jgi:hypothetical protein